MKRVLSALVACICFTSAAYAAGTVYETTFYSPSLVRECSVQIYLPDGYDPMGSTQYPVIYFLHGALDNHMGYPFILDIFDTMIEGQIIEPVIVIKPDGRSTPYIVSWFTNSILNGLYEECIVSDLVNYVETNYSVISDSKCRYVMGHSAGGYGAMTLGLKHPGVFSRLAAHSGVMEFNVLIVAALPALLAEYPLGPPYIWNPFAGFFSGIFFSMGAAFSPNFLNPPFYVDLPLDENAQIIAPIWQLWLQHNPPTYAAGLPPNTEPAIYFDCGTMDEMGCYPQNTVFADILSQLNIDHEFQEYVGDHSSVLPERFPISIAFLVGLKAHVYFQPTILHLGSSGSWITCHIGLPGDYLATDIDPYSVVLNEINGMVLDPPLCREGPIEICEYRGELCLMVKFNRQNVIEHLYTMGDGGRQTVELAVAGELFNGIPFHDVGALNVTGTGGPQGNEVARNTGGILYKCTPNPFSTTTAVRYEIPSETHVRIAIYNAVGQRVVTLVDAAQEAGSYSVSWEGTNLPNGIYICTMETDGHTETQKILLMK
ncbi:MAG: T9SS type A sorting domain-containing protein [candidate division WOR-3 bacterium]|nr:MAG: T9SS type A sorting domain-containing protein [candidate division WOR-3 bacterium]